MSDQELLELAARSIGGYYDEYTDCFSTDMINWEQWEPLEDDGDAFRLLHAINADIHHGENELGETIITVQPSSVPFNECPFCEAYDTEGFRRAIVRAAAAIGSEI